MLKHTSQQAFTSVAMSGVIVWALFFTGVVMSQSYTPLVVSPTRIVKNVTGIQPNVTMTFAPVQPYSQVFLLLIPSGGLGTFGSGRYNCSAPPPKGSSNMRTAVMTISAARTVSFDPRALDPGTYAICFRSITSAAAWVGYSKFFPLSMTVVVLNFAYCTGSSLQFGVCKVLPNFVSSESQNATLFMYYALPQSTAFLLKQKVYGQSNIYNCTSPPLYTTQLRSPIATVVSGSAITFDVSGLESGVYLICFRNVTAPNFVPLKYTVTVSGAIDAAKSTVSCCAGPFLVGQRTYCQIRAVDSNGYPTGNAQDACNFTACPVTDGSGQAVTSVMQPYMVGVGLYEFWFVGMASGCGASVGVSYNGQMIGNNLIETFTLYPGPINYTMGTSTCTFAEPDTVTCASVLRDSYGNPVSLCSASTSGPVVCNYILS